MRLIAGPLNKQLLQNLLAEVIEPCTRVRAAVAYGAISSRSCKSPEIRMNIELSGFSLCTESLRNR